MDRFSRISVAFSAAVAIAAVTALVSRPVPAATSAPFAQDAGKRGQAAKQREAAREAKEQERAAAEAARAKLKAERLASFVKLYPDAKTTLAAAVETAEKQTKGKAFDVAFHLDADGNLALSVGVVASERFYLVPINPQTGEASAAVEETEPDPDLGLPDEEE